MERKANDNELNLYTLEQDDVEDSKNPFSSILSMLDEKLTDILNTDEENINSSEEEEEEEKESITLDQSRLFKKKIIEQRTELEKLYDEYLNGFDIVIGSRNIFDSDVKIKQGIFVYKYCIVFVPRKCFHTLARKILFKFAYVPHLQRTVHRS